jgi:thiamine biosynthesis protein ThiI
MKDLLLVRLAAELTIKSNRTRSEFVRRLTRNLRDALRSSEIEHDIEPVWDRIYVRADAARAEPILARIPGISSVSFVERTVPAELPAIVAAGEEVYRDRVVGRRFAVRARRNGNHEFGSRDVEVQLGAALQPYSAGVDLTDPEVTVRIEVRQQQAYLFSERTEGVGGLPIGVEGRALALLSGGYDSAVAAWLMLKRGIALDYVFCNLGGDAYERAVLQVAKYMADEWSFGSRPRLHVVDFAPPLEALRAQCRQAYWQVVLKRLMYRTAERVARETGAEALVTGEAVGQVSSQTLANLRAIEAPASLPLLRPLVGFDKGEIIARARAIGTASLSEQVREYCAISPGRPVTAATSERLDEEERRLEPGVLDAVIAGRRTLDLRALQPTDLVAPYLFATDVPAGAVVIDCRPRQQYRAWHLKGAEHREEWEILRDFRKLDREKTYILYCAHGMQTAYIAEKMQRAGYEAYSFRGGLRGIIEFARRKGLNVTLLR